MLSVVDQPNPELVCGRHDVSDWQCQLFKKKKAIVAVFTFQQKRYMFNSELRMI